MVTNNLILFIFLFFCFSCHSQQEKEVENVKNIEKKLPVNLLNTTWEYKIAKGCVNLYDFYSEKDYKFYSCEMQDTMIGTYSVNNDTLIIEELGSAFDVNNKNTSDNSLSKSKMIIIISDNKLLHLKRYDWVLDHYVESGFKFSEDYKYTQVVN